MTSIGFIGAGQLGESMVNRLVGAGHSVLVYARNEEVRARLQRHVRLAESPAHLATESDIVISCLFSDAQLREVGLGPDGLIANCRQRSIFVSHTTGTVATLAELSNGFTSAPRVVDAPVSGTAEDIAKGRLTVLLGGDPDAVQQAKPILAAYGDPLIETGQVGTALSMKLVNNLLFAANAQLVAGAAELAGSMGISAGALLEAVSACSGSSRAAQYIRGYGGLDEFAVQVAPFILKDVAAAAAAADAVGAETGLLGEVALRGPLDFASP
jgi:3-hydroxyisobutyrate dehydrogenase-like beta-hydroxyacid dehydrogenase